MARFNTGMQRATELVVNKKIGGVDANGYPRTYRLYDGFGSYVSVTKDALVTMPVNGYKERLMAFRLYVEAIEVGITLDISGAYKKNLTACPLP